MALSGLGEDAIREAGWAAQLTSGISAYIYSTGYSQEQFKEDLENIVKHLTESAQ